MALVINNQGFSWLLKGVPGFNFDEAESSGLFAVEKGRPPPFHPKAKWSFLVTAQKQRIYTLSLLHCIVSSYI